MMSSENISIAFTLENEHIKEISYFQLFISITLLLFLIIIIFNYIKYLNSFYRFTDRSLSATVAVIGALGAGQISIYSTPIKEQIHNATMGIESFIALLGILFFGMLIYCKERGESIRKNEQATQQEQRLSFLPPKEVLQKVSDYIIAQSKYMNSLNKGSPQWPLEIQIEFTITSLLKLAADWDSFNDIEKVEYRSNLMIALPTRKISDSSDSYLRDSINHSPFFLFDDNFNSKLERCDGILFCNREYSYRLTTSGVEIPSSGDNPALCFPYTIGNKQEHQPVMFGAPTALIKNEVMLVENASEYMEAFLKKLEKSNDNYKKRFEENIRNYYGDGKPCSILSIPIAKPESSEVFALLNIYRDKEYIMRSDEKAKVFYELIKPICSSLSELLELLYKESDLPKDETAKEEEMS